MMEIVTGFIFGIIGSLHCIGMCGPIVLSLPMGVGSSPDFIISRTLYHLGRVLSYALMGAAVGMLGGKLLLPIFQQNLSVVIGSTIILTILFPKLISHLNIFKRIFEPLNVKLTAIIGNLLVRKTLIEMLALGFLNGFLPCGFVYMAISTALITGSSMTGIMFMVGFGFGTIPAMLGVSIFPRLMSGSLRMKVIKILPVFQIIIGLLLIVRGLNLGIPYLSPKFYGVLPSNESGCCH